MKVFLMSAMILLIVAVIMYFVPDLVANTAQ